MADRIQLELYAKVADRLCRLDKNAAYVVIRINAWRKNPIQNSPKQRQHLNPAQAQPDQQDQVLPTSGGPSIRVTPGRNGRRQSGRPGEIDMLEHALRLAYAGKTFARNAIRPHRAISPGSASFVDSVD
ncbi:MAG: hypothetical protein WKF37_22220 [Bryobacteraceae bacterium]